MLYKPARLGDMGLLHATVVLYTTTQAELPFQNVHQMKIKWCWSKSASLVWAFINASYITLRTQYFNQV